MALKKPSELFNNEPKKRVEVPEQLEGTLPENFDAYKSNVKNIEVLNDFVTSFGTLRENIQKIDNLQEVIQSLKEDLQNSITKEDLDTAMMSNLIVLEKNIQKIEFNLKGINHKDLKRIHEEIVDIESKVLYALEEEFPKYKKALKSSEIFLKDKFYEYSSEIDEKVNQFELFIESSFEIIQENLQSINDSQLIDIRENVIKSSQEVENQNKLIEKTKKQLFSLEKDVLEFYERIQETFQSYQQSQEEKILTLEESISSFGEEEVKKYKSLLQETRIQNDEKIQSFEKNLTEKYNELSQSVSSLISSVENKSTDLEEVVQNKLNDIEQSVSNSRTTLEETSNDYKKLIKSIEAKGLSDNQKFEKYYNDVISITNTVEHLKEDFKDIQNNLFIKEEQQKDIKSVKEQLSKKIVLLENDISFKENKIKKANKELAEAIENISNQFNDLNVEDLKKKYSHLTNKISYIEEVFEKFNEKTVLNEGLLNDPPTIQNSDPLTPLDQNFVTLDQLQQHYRLFINRIQQQLSTIGGGGETRLEFLDDVDRSTAKINGRFLKYDAASDKWIGAVGGGGGSQTLDDTLGLGNTSNLGMSVGVVTATSFYGDGSPLSGIVTTIIAGGGIYIDQSSGSVTITNTRDPGGENYWVSTSAGIHTLSSVGIGTTAKSDFKLFVEGNAKVTGILTVGNQSVTIDGSNNTIKVGSGVTINGNTGIISATAIYVAGSQVSTFSGNYNDLTNKPDLSSISVAYASTAGIATYAITSGVSTSVIGGIGSITQLRVSGVSTLGVTTFTGNVSFGTSAFFGTDDRLILGDSSNLQLYYNSVNSIVNASAGLIVSGSSITYSSDAHSIQNAATTRTFANFGASGATFYQNNNTKLQITSTGITVTGTTSTDQLSVSGVTTSTGGFVGSLTGNASSATYATTAGVATALQNSRTFQITGDIVASAVNFDGSGNVSLAATIQPNSVGLGTDTTGDYVQSVSGTANQITVTSGTGEGSSPTLSIPNQFTAPQDVTVARDLQVDRNLNVNGNITIGGTSATLFTTEFKVYDPDIVLGFRTDGSGNDTSNDNTANHGGIAIASTEGTPLISLYDVGIGETNPATYKKFMWFKSGTFSGLGTDAWISNYAIGIGSTQVPNGVRLAAGGMQVTDNTLRVPQLNISGVTTSTGGFVGNVTGTATTATVAQGLTGTPNITVGVVTATSFVKSGGTSSQFLKADGSVDSSTYLTSYTETDTLNSVTGRGNSTVNGISVGILTATSGNFSGIVTSSGAVISGATTATSFVKSGGTSSQFLKADGSVDSSTYLTTTGSGTNLTGIVTSIVAGTNVTISGSTGQVTINASGGGVNYWNQTAVGIHTLSNVGIGTTNSTESGLSVLGKIQILQKADSTSRLIFRGVPGTSYRWNIDNDNTNLFRIFREDDATAANGVVAVSISTTGTLTATKFSGDGSLLTGITATGSGVVVQNQGSNVGTAGTLNFSTNLTASFSSGTATISLSNNPSITGILTADQVYTSNNGNGTNVRIGDDLWIGDINVANTTRFSGAQDSTKAFVVFGTSDAVALGRTGTGPLYYGGNFNVSGVSSATSFSGSGTNLTGIVTSIIAGTNVTISGSTGQVTINATGGGGAASASLDILEVMMFA